MALISTPGLLYPPLFPFNITNGFASTLLIDATGEKVAMMGRVWWPAATAGQTKNITKIGFRWGAVTKAGGSGLTLSLQDVSLTAGPHIQPDGTQDQTVAIANGDAGFASNTWYKTNALSAVRTVGAGDLVAVVVEFDGGGRLGADSVIISSCNSGTLSATESSALFSGGSWASVSQSLMNVLLEFDDGTFGSFRSGVPGGTNYNVISYNPSHNPNEWAQKLVMPFKCVIDGAVVFAYTSFLSTGDFSISLENGAGSVLAGPIVCDFNAMVGANIVNYQRVQFPTPVTLNVGDTVYLCVKPITASQSVSIAIVDVNNPSHWQAWPFGDANINAASRNGGAWTQTTTRRLDFHLQVQKIDDGAGGGGGLLVNPGMRGGML